MPATHGRRTLGPVTTKPATTPPSTRSRRRAPAREYDLDAGGVASPCTSGATTADPLFLVHGGFDFARTYDVFAPLLAAAGWRVVAWDQRGHGDSEHAALYSWDGDLRDAIGGDRSRHPGRIPSSATRKGGALMIQLADAQPFRFTHLVNLDGIPYKRRMPDVSEHERTRMMAERHRRLARPPAHHRHRAAQARHARGARPRAAG